MTGSSRKPAQASVALTRKNYSGPNLLRTIKGKPTSPTVAAASSAAQMSSRMERESSEDINAPPQSEGSDEEGSLLATLSPTRQLDQVFKDIGQDVQTDITASTITHTGSTRSTRSRQPQLKDEELQLPSPTKFESEPCQEDDPMDSWLSQPNKRRKMVYGSRSARTTGGFRPAPPAPTVFHTDPPSSSFSMPKSNLDSPKSRTRAPPKDRFFAPPAVADKSVPEIEKGTGLNLPEIPLDLTSSATSPSGSLPVFNLHDSPKYSASKRSNSSSSLSSVDSFASLVLTQERKEALRQGEDDDKDTSDAATSRCPLCHSKVDQLELETFKFGRRLNIRDQQRFCQEHRHRDAEKLRKKMEYPTIDWPTLTNDRIPQQFTLLSGILKRTLPSYYRDRLDTAMKEGQGSRKGLQRYLKEGIVDVAKYGYYGPKGARIMGHTITTHMAMALKQELKRDKIARVVGVGGYVNAVLVPELAVRLVMEDMSLPDEQRARDVLCESSNIGILLNADDESITIEEEDVEM